MPKQEPSPGRQWWSLAWQRRWWIAAATLFILVWWLVPPLLYRHSGAGPDARLKAITDTRTALLAGLLGVGALLTFWLNSRVYRITARTFELAEQGQITERYTKAIEQLGNQGLAVRLGGIYALERLAVDSPEREHRTVVEVLSAFVREGSKRPSTPRTRERPSTPQAEWHRPETDIEAALWVLSRLPRQPDIPPGDLSDADLENAWLSDADLSGIRFDRANLSGARVLRANLSGARLLAANLSRIALNDADLSGADFRLAKLSGARLQDANLSGALFHGADLRDAIDIAQEQVNTADGNAATQLPSGLRRPDHWSG